MEPAVVDLSIVRGDSKRWVLTIANSAGVPYNITDWVIFFTVKSDVNDPDTSALIQKNITVHTTPLSGITELTLSPSDTASLLIGDHYYDIQALQPATPPNNNIYTVQRGKFSVTYDVTTRVAAPS